jgi:hypothetical protein
VLCPSLIDAEDDLVSAGGVVRRISAFASALNGAQIGDLTPRPLWLDEVSATLARGRKTASVWIEEAPTILPPLTVAFVEQRSTIAAIVEQLDQLLDDPAAWPPLLDELERELRADAQQLVGIQERMKGVSTSMNGVYVDMQSALGIAWDGHENAQVMLADTREAIGELYGRLEAYDHQATADDLSAGRSMVSTVVTMAWPLIMSGAAAGFLTIGFDILSVGASVATAISDDSQIIDCLGKLYGLLVQEDAEVQAVAVSAALLVLLEQLMQRYVAASQQLPRLSSLWSDEAAKIGIVQEALRAGSAPRDLTELRSLPAALATWTELAKIATNLVTAAARLGPPVELTPQPPAPSTPGLRGI